MDSKRTWGVWPMILILAILLSLTICAWGVYEFSQSRGLWVLLGGLLAVVMVLCAWTVGLRIGSGSRTLDGAIRQMNSLVAERLEQFSVMLNLISEQQLLSERTKMVAFRDKDRDAVNRAIREELARGQYDAALLLVNDMEAAFGYKQDAEGLRGEIAQLRDENIRRTVAEASVQIDRSCTSEKWDEALELAQQLQATFPDHELTRQLPEQILQRKESVKQQLLARWKDAVARKDIDGSVDILRQLDLYVTAEEVAELKDGALEIFKARIERLRERFKEDVQERKWAEAIQVGEDIVTEFPTSRIAQEVRDMMDTLRERAAEESGTLA